MCVTLKRENELPTTPRQGGTTMQITATVRVWEVDCKPCGELELQVTNHPDRRDYVIIERFNERLTVSASDLERAMQAARLAHKI